MKRAMVRAVVVILCVASVAAGAEKDRWQAMAERQLGHWSDHAAGPLFCSVHLRAKLDVELVSHAENHRALTIRFLDNGREVASFRGHHRTVFQAWKGTLYYADFSPHASGCTLLAVDLTTGKERWRRALRALGPIQHSAYTNKMTIDVFEPVVRLRGIESAGEYCEIVDMKTGRTLGHAVRPARHPALGKAAFGPLVHGLRLGLHVSGTQWAPGERLDLGVYFHNPWNQSLLVRHTGGRPLAGELHVLTPAGHAFTYRPPKRTTGGVFVHPGKTDRLRALSLRLSEPMPDWAPTSPDAPKRLSFRNEGVYRLWAEYTEKKNWEGSKLEWWGRARTETVAITVRKPAPAALDKAPTPEQLADLARFVAPASDRKAFVEAKARLEAALARAVHEGLAGAVVEVFRTGRFGGAAIPLRSRQELFRMLSLRAGSAEWRGDLELGRQIRRVLPGIDGPYLRALVHASLAAVAKLPRVRPKKQPEFFFRDLGDLLTVLTAYLKLHPEGAATRKRAVDLWRGFKSRAAWEFFFDIGALRKGMSVRELVALLGKPTRQNDQVVDWYINTHHHVNPYLAARLQDGKVTRFQMGVR